MARARINHRISPSGKQNQWLLRGIVITEHVSQQFEMTRYNGHFGDTGPENRSVVAGRLLS